MSVDDANDPITAEAVGRMPPTYTQSLDPAALRGARIGVIREPLDPKADPTSGEYLQVQAVINRALEDLRRLGADVVDLSAIRGLAVRSARLYDDNVYETEAATDAYLAKHPEHRSSGWPTLTSRVLTIGSRLLRRRHWRPPEALARAADYGSGWCRSARIIVVSDRPHRRRSR